MRVTVVFRPGLAGVGAGLTVTVVFMLVGLSGFLALLDTGGSTPTLFLF